MFLLAILSYHVSFSFFFFLIIDLYFLVPAAIAQIFVAAELAIPTGIPNKEAKADVETDPVTES